jgi:hypothetical protein
LLPDRQAAAGTLLVIPRRSNPKILMSRRRDSFSG